MDELLRLLCIWMYMVVMILYACTLYMHTFIYIYMHFWSYNAQHL